MATLRNGFNGHFSGRVGDVVGSSWRGIQVLKSRPSPSEKPKTEKQLAQQARFALAIKFLKPMRDILDITFSVPRKPATGFNLAVKHVLENAISGLYPDYSIDYNAIAFSKGSLGRPMNVEVLADGSNLVLAWSFLRNYLSFADDEVMVLAYDPDCYSFIKGPVGICRAEKFASIKIPDAYIGKTLQIYVYCNSRCGKVSDTVYAGSVLIT